MARKFFVEKGNIQDSIVLIGDEHNHLANVLRHKTGDMITVYNNTGIDYTCEIESIEKKQTVLKVLSKKESEADSKINLTVFQALLKNY